MFKYIAFAIILLTSCTVNQQLGYFEMKPFVPVGVNRVNQPLYVQFSERVSDQFNWKQSGFTFNVTQLHKSYLYGTRMVYGDVFSEVRLYQPNDYGFILSYQLLEPKWTFEESLYTDSISILEPVCTIAYSSSLYRNELLMNQTNGSVSVTQSSLGSFAKPDTIFKEATKQCLSKIAESHLNRLR
ncbi:MAG: hypothetical protein MUE96_04245 [Bacteroidia bacterium]|jgi:hypothetical protein|nr:hypothetical protein [Bacteroidia bacterium]